MPPKRGNQHAAPLSKCGEKLINEVIRLVQANSLLYDLSDGNYRNGWVRENVYQIINDELEVKKICYLDGTPADAKAVWNSLLAKYKGLKAKIPSGSGAEQKVNWPYFESMRFIDKVNRQNDQRLSVDISKAGLGEKEHEGQIFLQNGESSQIVPIEKPSTRKRKKNALEVLQVKQEQLLELEKTQKQFERERMAQQRIEGECVAFGKIIASKLMSMSPNQRTVLQKSILSLFLEQESQPSTSKLATSQSTAQFIYCPEDYTDSDSNYEYYKI